MNKKLYIELLEAEIQRLRKNIREKDWKLLNAREQFDPFYRTLKSLAQKTEQEIYGIRKLAKESETKRTGDGSSGQGPDEQSDT